MAVPDAPAPAHAPAPMVLPERLPEKPSVPPAFAIPVDALGFTAPAPFYLGQRNSLVSLDFLDENRLLFTFRVPGLIRREAGAKAGSDERQIRALVVALPSGNVEAEALWTVHDHARYLWMLHDGHFFLLRDRNSLEQGDATLELKPFLRFSGPLVWMETDPAQQYLVTNTRETAGDAGKPGTVPSPPTAAASISVDGQKAAAAPEMAVRILRRDTGQVMFISHVRSTIHLPINTEGYIESLRGRGNAWLLNLRHFSGGATPMGQVDSACSPLSDFLSEREFLVTTCTPSDGGRLVAITTDGRQLWQAKTSGAAIWPLLVRSPDGLRLAREVLIASHSVNARAPIDQEDIKGQLIEILDAADGHVELEAAATPVLDGGGNLAISPSGRRVAILSGGRIQIFELPASPPLTAGGQIH